VGSSGLSSGRPALGKVELVFLLAPGVVVVALRGPLLELDHVRKVEVRTRTYLTVLTSDL
jgi:hypothetical protein